MTIFSGKADNVHFVCCSIVCPLCKFSISLFGFISKILVLIVPVPVRYLISTFKAKQIEIN